jgi:hypothetical protein
MIGHPETGHRRWIAPGLAVGLVALGLAAASCGGSGSDHPGSVATPTRPAPASTQPSQPASPTTVSADDQEIERELAQIDAEGAQDDADLSALDRADQQDAAVP